MTEEEIWIVTNSVLNALPTAPQANIQKKRHYFLPNRVLNVHIIDKTY